jgi:hypothetical protein
VLRAANLERETAASVLLHLAGREEAVADQLDHYDSLEPAQARHHILLWSLDPAYRAALARLAS